MLEEFSFSLIFAISHIIDIHFYTFIFRGGCCRLLLQENNAVLLLTPFYPPPPHADGVTLT